VAPGHPPESMGVRLYLASHAFAVALLSALCIRFAFGAVAVYAPYFPAILIATIVAGPSRGSSPWRWEGLPDGQHLNSAPSTNFPVVHRGIRRGHIRRYWALIVWVAAAYRQAIMRLKESERKIALCLESSSTGARIRSWSCKPWSDQTLKDNKEQAQKINDRIAAPCRDE